MKYDFKKIESKWREKWQKEKVYEPDLDKAKDPFYNLMMFPYPSAEGLHVGNMYAFTGSDIYGRYQRMNGKDVFEPIGLDGFGIHSENYAIKIGTHPVDQAKKSEKNFYRQLNAIGAGFAWDEKLETYDPDYYKWTQWLFTKMFENGLAYRKKSPVNWCPSCKTVLADEQVEGGKCERCSSEVERKKLEQWFFKITEYADELLDDLEDIDWPEKIKIAQRNWVGRSEGALINFEIKSSDQSLKVFTTRADTIEGATYMVVAPEHEIINSFENKIENIKEVKKYIEEAKNKTEQQRIEEAGNKTGVPLKGVVAINPFNKEELPIWIADYVLASYGTGAIMAVPSHDERDKEFAEKFNLPIVEKELLDFDKAIKESGGEKHTNYKLRDWLISRQRYWGPPIPMVFCENCEKEIKEGGTTQKFNKGELENPGWIAVPKEDLPIKLPYLENFKPKGDNKSPLASEESFYKTACPKCDGKAIRETDVSDTFLDSSWYYLRYLSVNNNENPFDDSRAKKWLPVNIYIGGAEHAVLHLLYSRFVAKALSDWGIVNFREPFEKLKAHGLLIKEGSKMSKSKGNVINPDDYIKSVGTDVLRTYLMFLAPFEQGGDFRDAGIMGIDRFIQRVWKLSQSLKQNKKNSEALEKALHQSIKKVTEDIENLKYNTAISQLMILLSEMEDNKDSITKEAWESFIKLLAPFSPHITEEIWREILGNKESIHVSEWPKHKEELIREDDFDLIIQINGKTRETIKMNKGIEKDKAIEISRDLDKIKKYLEGQEIKKTIFVKDTLINFVI